MSSKILVGFLAGAAVGALAGILFAPDKGSNTRRKIADKSGDIKDSVKNSYNDFVDGVKQTYAGAKEEAEDFANKAKAKLDGVKHEVKNAMS
ncbi:MAG: YtxH domain-containing protein [Chitinophagaceae bacterium]|jgi:gas vesicle protein|nr:YtxH domain-containing protein [Chitinophagaceae bacterium]MBK7680141.1 YtxH domain-containing protein [Chitinophagaceae bacterium]MBK8301102.1 YtxH domain-containing protein [Chitinophagaceae bacterium]MBK9660778.1 YtxH domain-containing protein [Chitinophagaceae bacterium]MBP6232707.1 YtxH domain-containing protein [Chitinophagaceae bacterium]